MLVVPRVTGLRGQLMDCGDESSLPPTYHSRSAFAAWKFVAFCSLLKENFPICGSIFQID